MNKIRTVFQRLCEPWCSSTSSHKRSSCCGVQATRFLRDFCACIYQRRGNGIVKHHRFATLARECIHIRASLALLQTGGPLLINIPPGTAFVRAASSTNKQSRTHS